jgi:uncharacterized protein YtpQ (UPF0354 family)
MPALAQPKTLSPQEFTDAFATAVAAAQPGLTVLRKDRLFLSMKTPTGRNLTVFLDNAYRDYMTDPARLDAVFKRYVSFFLETSRQHDRVDRTRIVPVVKDRQWIADIQKSAPKTGEQIVGSLFDSINDDLVVLYAEDNPQSIRYIGAKLVADAGVERKSLRALAIENLRRLLPPIEFHPGAMFSRITAGGDYETSLLLFDDIWAKAAAMVDGEIVVAIPARGLLLFTGSRNQAGLARLREVAAKLAHEEKYFLTPKLFVYRGGKFVVFAASGP